MTIYAVTWGGASTAHTQGGGNHSITLTLALTPTLTTPQTQPQTPTQTLALTRTLTMTRCGDVGTWGASTAHTQGGGNHTTTASSPLAGKVHHKSSAAHHRRPPAQHTARAQTPAHMRPQQMQRGVSAPPEPAGRTLTRAELKAEQVRVRVAVG